MLGTRVIFRSNTIFWASKSVWSGDGMKAVFPQWWASKAVEAGRLSEKSFGGMLALREGLAPEACPVEVVEPTRGGKDIKTMGTGLWN